jgi:phenylacetate-CoA ligase
LIDRIAIYVTLTVLWILRRGISSNSRSYLLLNAGFMQPFLARVGLLRAHAVYLKAKRRCPAYREFLKANRDVTGKWQLSRVPVMTKENYIKKYSIQDRCYEGEIPATGVVIDESSGSSGTPNNWVRSPEEREDVKRILQLNYRLIYRDRGCILLNCFALGPWATGMNVSMSLVDVGILKSLGPDQQKLENTLEMFGTRYRYLIFGYPPFIKAFVDSTRLDLTKYNMDLIVGGEGISEGLRGYLRKYFKSVISSYGASDLEINIGVETELTVNLRGRCMEDAALSQKLFGRETPPMIFQYNSVDYIIERAESGELLFTIGRQDSAAPKIRYNLRDLGGVMSHKELSARLSEHGVDTSTLAGRQSKFPILYVFGRGDLTVPFYGSKIFPTNLEEIINIHAVLVTSVNSFQIASFEDDKINRRLKIHLELVQSLSELSLSSDELRDIFFDGLCRLNQDFREVTKMFDRSCVSVELHQFGTGPFAGRDIRIKNKYIGS